MGNHSGGYTAFTFDITDQYKPGAELLVGVYDPSDCVFQEHKVAGGKPGQQGPNPCPANLKAAGARGQQPIGKQSWGIFGNASGTAAGNSQGIKYTPTSGIWQTVWLESVPRDCYLGTAHITTSIDGSTSAGAVGSIGVTPTILGKGCRDTFDVEVYDRGTGATIVPRKAFAGEARLGLPSPAKLWSPTSPFLYGLRLFAGADVVEAYAGVRVIKVSRSEVDGLPRTHLNGLPFYQAGVLGQGFYPESLYAAPTDTALESDIVQVNLKHNPNPNPNRDPNPRAQSI